MNATFDEVWRFLQGHLQKGMVIQNWTTLKGYYGDNFTIDWVGSTEISVNAPGAKNLQVVPKDHFEVIWKIWPAYRSGSFQRQEIRELTRYSKYIISILHWYEKEASHA